MPFITTTPRQTTRWLALTGIGGSLVFVLGSIVGGLLRPGYSPMIQAISDLGVGSNNWIMNSAIVIFGLSILALAIALYRSLPEFKSRRTLSIMLGIVGILWGACGFFQEPIAGQPITLTGFLHFFLFLFVGMPLFMVELFMLGSKLRRFDPLRQYANFTLLAAWLIVILAPATSIFFNPSSPLYKLGVGGLFERLLFVVVCGWLITTGWLLVRRNQ